MATFPKPGARNLTPEARNRLIESGDVGPVVRMHEIVKKLVAAKAERKGRLLNHAIQFVLGLLALGVLLAIVRPSLNIVSGWFCVLFLTGAVLGGAGRFLLWSIIWWSVTGLFSWLIAGQPFLARSWWHALAQRWSGGGDVPWWVLGGGVFLSLLWIAFGRIACKGMGIAAMKGFEKMALRVSEERSGQRSREVEAEFERTGVSKDEAERVVTRVDVDSRRQVIFGGQRVESSQSRRTVDLGKDPVETGPQVDLAKGPEAYSDMSGKVSDQDAGMLASLVGGDDDEDELFVSSVKPSAPVVQPAPAPAPVAASSSLPIIPSSTVSASGDIPKAAAPTVRAAPNPGMSEQARRGMLDNLNSMISVFKIHSSRDQVETFYKNCRIRLLKLTDEDYDELSNMDFGAEIITLSRRVKQESLRDNREIETAPTFTPPEFPDAAVEDEVMTVPVVSTGNKAADMIASLGAALGSAPAREDKVEPEKVVPTSAIIGYDEDDIPQYSDSVETDMVIEDGISGSPLGGMGALTGGILAKKVATPPVQDADDQAASAGEPASQEHSIEARTPDGQTVSFQFNDQTEEAPADGVGEGDMQSNGRVFPESLIYEAMGYIRTDLHDHEIRQAMVGFESKNKVRMIDVLQSDAALRQIGSEKLGPVLDTVRRVKDLDPRGPLRQLEELHARRYAIVDSELAKTPWKIRDLEAEFKRARAEMQEIFISAGFLAGATELMGRDKRLDSDFDARWVAVRDRTAIPETKDEHVDPFAGLAHDVLVSRGAIPDAEPQDVVDAARESAETASRPPHDEDQDAGERHVEASDDEIAPVLAPASASADASVEVIHLDPKAPDYHAQLRRLMEAEEAKAADRDRLRQEQEAAEQAEADRIEAERVEAERAAAEAATREAEAVAERERAQRVEKFRSSIGVRNNPLVDVIPDRFDDPTIVRAVAFAIEAHALLRQLRLEHASARDVFIVAWQSDHDGSHPSDVEMMNLDSYRAENEITIQLGARAREVVRLVGVIAGISSSEQDGLRGLMRDEAELRFIDIMMNKMNDGESASNLLEESHRVRTDEAIAEARRTAASEAEAIRTASEVALAEERAAREEVERELAEMRADRERLAAELAIVKPVIVDPSEELATWLAENGEAIDNQVGIQAFLFKTPRGYAVTVDLGDDVFADGVIEVSGHKVAIDMAIERGVLGLVRAKLSFGEDVNKVLVVTNVSHASINFTIPSVMDFDVTPRELKYVQSDLQLETAGSPE